MHASTEKKIDVSTEHLSTEKMNHHTSVTSELAIGPGLFLFLNGTRRNCGGAECSWFLGIP